MRDRKPVELNYCVPGDPKDDAPPWKPMVARRFMIALLLCMCVLAWLTFLLIGWKF